MGTGPARGPYPMRERCFMSKSDKWNGIELPTAEKATGKKKGYVPDPTTVGYTIKLDIRTHGRKLKYVAWDKKVKIGPFLNKLVTDYLDSISEEEFAAIVAKAAVEQLGK